MKRLLTICLLSCLALSVQAETFYIGRVSDNVSVTVERMKLLGEDLIAHLESSRFDRVEVVVTPELATLVREAANGRVHWATDSALAAAYLTFKGNMEPTLVRHKRGRDRYSSVLVGGADHQPPSAEQGFKNLIGKRIAAEDAGSLSGFFLVYKAIIDDGAPVTILGSVRDSPRADRVNIIFSGDEENNLHWLKLGLVDAAIFSDADYADAEFFPAALREETVLLHQTETYPRALELLSQQLTGSEQEAIKTRLQQLAEDGNSPLLRQYERTTGFHEVDERVREQLRELFSTAEADCESLNLCS